jgi:sulfur carrier protein ThiS
MNGKNTEWRESFIYEGLGTFGGTKPNLAVVSKNYRYIETYEDKELNKNIYQELYDQNRDRGEVNNLIGQKGTDEIIRRFQHEIKQHKQHILRDFHH